MGAVSAPEPAPSAEAARHLDDARPREPTPLSGSASIHEKSDVRPGVHRLGAALENASNLTAGHPGGTDATEQVNLTGRVRPASTLASRAQVPAAATAPQALGAEAERSRGFAGAVP